MLELFERFVAAIERLAENSEKQTQLLMSGSFQVEAPATEPAPAPETQKRSRRTKAEIEAEKAAETLKETIAGTQEVTLPEVNEALKALAKRDEGDLTRAKQIIASITGKDQKLLDIDKSHYPAILKAAQEAFHAPR